MDRIRARVITLRSVKYQDRDQIVSGLSESYGKISALAKNSIQSRRYGGCLDPFVASEWQMSRRPESDLWSLERSEARRDFAGIRGDFVKLSTASYWNELILKLVPENEPLPLLFKLHVNALIALEEDKSGSSYALLCGYLGKFLQLNGAPPQLSSCLRCQRAIESFQVQEEVRMEGEAGGWTCHSCPRVGAQYGFHPLSTGLLRIFRGALEIPIRQSPTHLGPVLSESEGEKLFEFLIEFSSFHLPGHDPNSFNSLRFIRKKTST